MSVEVEPAIIEAALAEAKAQGRDPADVPLEDIARRANISRATLYRRIGSRRVLDEAVRAAGVDPGGRPSVRDRAAEAAVEVITRDGLGAMTLDAVAAQAGCSLPALYDQFGGREGLLTAVFERYSPLRRFEALLATPPASFEAGVRGIYAAGFDAATAQPRLAAALVAEALTRPQGPIARQLLGTFAPRILGLVGGWLAAEVASGRCRPLPLPLLVQLLVGPMIANVATRDLSERVIGEPPAPREEVIETLTAAYFRAVALAPPAAEEPTGPIG